MFFQWYRSPETLYVIQPEGVLREEFPTTSIHMIKVYIMLGTLNGVQYGATSSIYVKLLKIVSLTPSPIHTLSCVYIPFLLRSSLPSSLHLSHYSSPALCIRHKGTRRAITAKVIHTGAIIRE